MYINISRLQAATEPSVRQAPPEDLEASAGASAPGQLCKELLLLTQHDFSWNTLKLCPRVCISEHWSNSGLFAEREFFVDNLMVRIHFIVKMISVDRPCAMGV